MASRALPAHTETLEVAGQIFTGTVGFDPEDGRPRELFLTAGKEGSLINAMLADAAVAISVALQHGISAQALAKSIGRLPEAPIAPADLLPHSTERESSQYSEG